jgi:ATP-binding cassette subfamily C protein CydC
MAIAENHSNTVFFAEDAHLFATTVRDNLLVARGDASDDELRKALWRVGLGGWLDSLPEGLSTVMVGGAAAVSAGQRRRLLLARALISTVPRVLLDEPTEHLDADAGQQIPGRTSHPGCAFPVRTHRRRGHPPPGRPHCLSATQARSQRVTSPA